MSELQIEITSKADQAEKNLDGITAALGRIEESLKSLTSSLSSIAEVGKSTSGSIQKIADVVSKIDSKKMDNLAYALGKVSTESEKASSKVSKSMDAISNKASEAEKNINKITKSITKDFFIKPDGVDSVKKVVTELHSALVDFNKAVAQGKRPDISDYVGKSLDDLQHVISKFANVKLQANEMQKAVVDAVKTINQSGSKVILGESIQKDIDNLAELQRLLGKGFVQKGEGTPFDVWFNNSGLDKYVNDINTASDAFRWLTETIKNARDAERELVISAKEFQERIRTGNGSMTQDNAANSVAVDYKSLRDTAIHYMALLQRIVVQEKEVAKVFEEDIAPATEKATTSIAKFSDYAERAFKLDIGGGIVESFKQLPAVIQGTSASFAYMYKQAQHLQEVSVFMRNIGNSVKYLEEDLSRTARYFLPMKQNVEDIEKAFCADIGKTDIYETMFGNMERKLPALIQATSASFAFMFEQMKGMEGISNVVADVTDSVKYLEKDLSKTATYFLPMKEAATETAQEVKQSFESIAEEAEIAGEKISSASRPETWKDIIADVEAAQGDFQRLAETIGDANAEMQILTDIKNRLNKAFSDTASGRMLFDIPNMQKAQQILTDADDKLKRFYSNLKDPHKLEIDVTEPVHEIEKLYARLKELQSLLSDMRGNKINFTDDQFKNTLKEYEEVQKKIRAIEGKGSDPFKEPNKSGLEFMATIIAIQHELEKMSGVFDKLGNFAASIFKKALVPLKLFEHEFDSIKTTVSRIGSAFAMMSKPITKVFSDMKKRATAAINAIEKRMNKLMRTFVYMGFRKIFTSVYNTMGEAIKSLAAFSKSIGTQFNGSMSLITSDFRYIGAALVAAFEPLINVVVPLIDRFVDVLVDAINKVNMFFTALTGAKSFTIAKKKIVDYTDALKDANKAAKQLTLGIDELNILNDNSATADTGLDDLFEWEEIDSSAIPKSIQDAADKVKDIANQLWNPIAKAWDNVGDYVKDSFKRMLTSIKALLSDIGRDFLKVWNQPKTVEMLEHIFSILGDIFNIIANIADGWREAWNYNKTGLKILEHIRDIFYDIFYHIHNITSAMVDWTASLDWIPLFTAIEKALGQVEYAVDQIGWVVEDLFDLFMKLGSYLIEDWAPRIIGVFGDVAEGIGNIAKQIHEAWNELDFGTAVADGINGVMQQIIPHLEELGEYFKVWGDSLNFRPIMNSFTDLLHAMEPVADFVSGTLVEAFEKLFLGEIQHLIEHTFPGLMDAISHFSNAVEWDKLRDNMSKIIDAASHLQHAISDAVVKAIDNLGQAVARFVNSKTFTDFIDNLANFVKRIDGDMIAKILEGIGLAILKIAEGLMKFVNSKAFQDFLDGLIKFMNNKNADQIADIILGLAKAFIAFKGASIAAKGIADILSFLPGLAKLAEILGPTGMLVVGLGVAGAAFLLFGDQLAAINWGKILDSIINGLIGLINAIDWQKFGENLAMVVAKIVSWGIEKAFDPEWRLKVIEAIGNALIGIVQGLADGWFNVLIGAFESVGLDSIAGLLKGLQSAWDSFIEFVGTIFQGLIDFVKSILGIESPSKVFEEIGQYIIQGLYEGILAIWQTIVDFFTTCWNFIAPIFSEAWAAITELIVGIWNGILTTATEIWGAITIFISEAWAGLQTLAETVFGFIRDFVSDAWTRIQEITDAVWSFVRDFLHEVFDGLGSFITETVETIRNTINTAWEFIQSVTETIWNTVKTFLETLWGGLKAKAEEIFGAVKEFLETIWNAVEGTWSTVWGAITSTITSIWNAFMESIHSIWDWVSGFFESLWDAVSEAWSTVWDNIITTITTIWDGFMGSIHSAWDWVVGFFEGLFDTISGVWSSVWGTIIKVVTDVWNDFISTIHRTWETIVETMEKIWDSVSDTWKSVWNGITGYIKNSVNSVIGFVEGMINGVINGVNSVIELLNKINFHFDPPDWAKELGMGSIDIGFSLPKIPTLSIPRFATGGFPEDGLFYANHNELVGEFANGRTAVANNNQIENGIRDAVASVLAPYLAEIAENTGNTVTAVERKNLTIGDREIARAASNGSSKIGRSLVTIT